MKPPAPYENAVTFQFGGDEPIPEVGRREAHIAYFERNGGYAPDMMLACERFRVVAVFPQ